MGSFWKALLWTAIPFLILAIIGAVVTRTAESNVDDIALGWAIGDWLVGGAFSLGAIVAGIVFGVRHKRRIMAGIFTGLAIGIVVLGASCFAIPGMF
ncbi:MAG: hypothetical protein A2158_01735 [Chloroflexi bacterium RBG_13_46_14]|nr:MAG: hypothetical protein A2158_01735 [Chloroflexi bacterium RBG_13_46_14]